ncbi:MAG: hypothetical protein P4M15_14015 [Alphaproteobacteria bacterium]|nr:hypothetical protein [Alphaproteobacteria bacterium]
MPTNRVVVESRDRTYVEAAKVVAEHAHIGTATEGAQLILEGDPQEIMGLLSSEVFECHLKKDHVILDDMYASPEEIERLRQDNTIDIHVLHRDAKALQSNPSSIPDHAASGGGPKESPVRTRQTGRFGLFFHRKRTATPA